MATTAEEVDECIEAFRAGDSVEAAKLENARKLMILFMDSPEFLRSAHCAALISAYHKYFDGMHAVLIVLGAELIEAADVAQMGMGI